MSRRPRPTAKLVLYGQDGSSYSLDWDREELDALVRRLLRDGGARAELSWSRTGILSARSLLDRWRREDLLRFPAPATAVIRSGSRFLSGFALQIETELRRVELPQMALELLRLLRSRGSVREVEVEAVPVNAWQARSPGLTRITAEDLAWLLPGEWLSSARHGRYRLKKADPDGGRFLLRNAGGDILSLTAEELQADFRRVEP